MHLRRRSALSALTAVIVAVLSAPVAMSPAQATEVTTTVDDQSPVLRITAPDRRALIFPGNPVTVGGTITDENPMNAFVEVTRNSDGARVFSALDTSGIASISRTFSTAEFAPGTYTVLLRARDSAGNEPSEVRAQFRIAPETSPPAVMIAQPAAGASITRGTPLTVAGTITDVNPWRTFVDISRSGAQVFTFTDETGLTSFSRTLDTADFLPGDYTFTLSARDGALNKNDGSTMVVQFSVVDDVTAPVTTISGLDSGETYRGTVTVTGSASDVGVGVDSVELVVQTFDSSTNDCTGSPVSFPATIGPEGAWTAEVDSLRVADGANCLIARVDDRAGNSNDATTRLVDVRFDNTAPDAVTLLGPADGATAGTGTLDLDWTLAEADATCEVRVALGAGIDDDGMLVDTSAGYAGSTAATSLEFSAILEQTYYWQVRAIDAVGNVGAWSAVSEFTVQVPTVTPPIPDSTEPLQPPVSTEPSPGTSGAPAGASGAVGAPADSRAQDELNEQLSTFPLDDATSVQSDEVSEFDQQVASPGTTWAIAPAWWWLLIVVAALLAALLTWRLRLARSS